MNKIKVEFWDAKVRFFEENRVWAIFDGFQTEMGSERGGFKSAIFYRQIALRTPLIEAEISKIAKIAIFMVWGT